MPRRGSDLLFALLVLLALAMTVVLGLVLSGRLVSDPADSGSTASPLSALRPRRQPQTDTATITEARPAVQLANVGIAATRGDCWVVAHAGSAAGRVLIERVLLSGQQVTLHAHRIWLELGAAGNVDITLNGKQRPLMSGTTQVVLG